MTNVYETVMKNFTMPGLNGSFTAIIEYYFIVVSLTINIYFMFIDFTNEIDHRNAMYYNTFYLPVF